MRKINFKLTFSVNNPIVNIESKNQRFLYGWRYDGTLFFFSSKPSKIAIQQMKVLENIDDKRFLKLPDSENR